MKKLLCAVVMAIVCLPAFSQNGSNNKTEGQNSFFAELGGPGILFSANVDHRFNKSRLGWGGRIGVGFVSGYLELDTSFYYYGSRPTSVVTFPVQVNYIFGKGNSPHTFEVGAGITYTGRKLDIFNYYDDRRTNFYATTSFMYRRQPANGGFSWRIGFTPLIARGYIQPSGALSVGYNF